jgi:type II secretory pathway pseudopilin PulG
LKNKSGISLIELLVVCVLITLLAGLSISMISILQHTAVRAELALLQTTCRYMQQLASATHQEQRLYLDPIHNSYRYNAITHTLHPQVQFGYLHNTKGPPANSDSLINKPVSFVDNVIIFYPTGIISSGTLYLTNTKRTCCYALSNGVAHVSYLRSYIYKNGWHIVK